eukprot:CAMPEP_0194446756 /NCGR_PEP_ID=MMETSP0176-20130528/128620_1 /TAXON_ID=216777 /ORGANISM="Proboscia alata, Strain PI-D3" /LENGTH=350 /DNA_ID=CAMNT_0039273515 /DNA_START=44 /DNA_END=1096 /DNA_ORIENTATION=+
MESSSSTAVMADLVPSLRVASGSSSRREKRSPKRRVNTSSSSSDDDDSDDEYILEKSNSKLSRKKMKRNVLPANNELWIAHGQCPKCGIQTHTIDGSSRLPITDEDVRKGRCLLCNPLPASHSRSSPLPNIVPPSSSKPSSASATQSASTAPVSSPPDARCNTTAIMNPASKTPLAPTTPTPHDLQPSRAYDNRFRDSSVWGEYNGEIDTSGKRHGRGIMKWDNGDVYDGEWKGNKKHGKGILRRGHGVEYDGEWKGNKKHGKGILRWNDGGEYDGEWKGNMRHGKGILRWNDGKLDMKLYKNNLHIGDGAQWSADRQTAWRIKRNKVPEKITLKAAAAIASRIGIPVPT